MATQMLSLSQPSGNRSAVLCTLARQKAVKAVKERLRAQGLKLAQFSAGDIYILADAYFEVHRQRLIEAAIETVSNSQELRKLYAREQRQRARALIRRSSQIQWVRLCRCQVQNDNDWICESKH